MWSEGRGTSSGEPNVVPQIPVQQFALYISSWGWGWFSCFLMFFAKLLQVFFVTGHAQPISSSSSARSAFIGMEAMRGETMTGWTLVWGKMVTLCLFNVAMDKHHFLICPYKSVMFQSYVKSLESARTIRPEFNVRLSALDCSYKML